jgi:ribonuclease T1
MRLFYLCTLLLLLIACRREQPKVPPGIPLTPAVLPAAARQQDKAPPYVWATLQHIRATGKAPKGYVGGRTFENRERRLPRSDRDGLTVAYREWDVHPKVQGVNRGAERLVTGSDQSAWYTPDHYRTFTRLE